MHHNCSLFIVNMSKSLPTCSRVFPSIKKLSTVRLLGNAGLHNKLNRGGR